jgi:hypothetical protein
MLDKPKITFQLQVSYRELASTLHTAYNYNLQDVQDRYLKNILTYNRTVYAVS